MTLFTDNSIEQTMDEIECVRSSLDNIDNAVVGAMSHGQFDFTTWIEEAEYAAEHALKIAAELRRLQSA